MSGTWAANIEKAEELSRRWGVEEGNRPAVEALLWSSYAVGMELPGKNALFFRVALDFGIEPITEHAIAYVLKVTGANKTISQIKIDAELLAALSALLMASWLRSFVRNAGPRFRRDRL